jgi:hypothetical protein
VATGLPIGRFSKVGATSVLGDVVKISYIKTLVEKEPDINIHALFSDFCQGATVLTHALAILSHI